MREPWPEERADSGEEEFAKDMPVTITSINRRTTQEETLVRRAHEPEYQLQNGHT